MNALVGRAVDFLLFPFRQLPPIAGLAAVSLASAVALLLIFRKTSDQARLAAVKRQMRAAIYEIRLFNDDLRAIVRAQAEILRHNLTYLRLTLVPTLWILVPLGLLIAQLQFHYGYGGLRPGHPVLVKAQLRNAVVNRGPDPVRVLGRLSAPEGGRVALLDAPDAIDVLTPAVWFPATGEVIWRISPKTPGAYELQVRADGESFSKTLRVSDEVVRRSPARLERGFLNQLLYPAEPPLPEGAAVTAITIAYPRAEIRVLGWELHWMIVYFGLTMVFAFALRKQFNVTM